MQKNHVKKLRFLKKTIIVLNGQSAKLQAGNKDNAASHNNRVSCGAGDCTTVPPSLTGNPCTNTKPYDPGDMTF